MTIIPIASMTRASTSYITVFAIVTCLVMLFPQIIDAAYVVSVPAKDEECFIIASPGAAGGLLYGNFDHLDDSISSEPLAVVVIDAKEEHVLFRSRRRATEGSFRVNLKANQKVNLCLQNGLVTAGRGRKSPTARSHDGKPRTVGFAYTVEATDENQLVHTQHDRNKRAAGELVRSMANLMTHHQYMRARENTHREVVEQTFTQLMWWVVLESVVVIAIAGAQIMYFRNFLERRRYM